MLTSTVQTGSLTHAHYRTLPVYQAHAPKLSEQALRPVQARHVSNSGDGSE